MRFDVSANHIMPIIFTMRMTTTRTIAYSQDCPRNWSVKQSHGCQPAQHKFQLKTV